MFTWLQSDAFQLINYNISGGKRIRGALVPAAMEAFKSKQSTRKCHVREAHLIGWCIELIHAGFLVLDDIMDDSPVRRGKPSWFHTQQAAGYGLISVNDGIHLILTAKFLLYSIFDKSAENDTVLLRIIRLFDEVCYKTCWGQNLDTIYSQTMRSTAADSTTNVDLDKYTWKNYEKITRWKTGFYTFYLPVACGMALAGIQEASCYDQAANILLKLGQYFQAQDDFLDCFGDPTVTGKVGTDIVDGKCSWLVVTCLSKASEKQLQTIKESYGHKDPGAEATVRRVFEELGLRDAFRKYEEDMRAEIEHEVSNCDQINCSDLFEEIIQLLFGRVH
ncbi:Farnesyl pyrophosphate synthase vrtD [Fasciola hepatica]|uniref:Farnesyl pyrophosphate synthase n=1 Tax=Fasciola hepatica TaxID=6192 RepID=A0A4E0R691_FASHE|nr:Farnesyl pyrophosphate synthase vrtD [Fasciola hepatica]